MTQEKETPQIAFNQDQLLALIKEMRKPADPTPEQIAQKQGEIENRKHIAQQEHAKQANRKAEQEYCPHTRYEDGSTRMVYVQNGNYLICQACQFILRPEDDVKTFNQHFGRTFQKTTF